MSMTVRLQVLIDEPRARRLDVEAARRGVSVAALVREGIDRVLPQGPTAEERRAAIERILAAPQIAVPDPEVLKSELADAHDRMGKLERQ